MGALDNTAAKSDGRQDGNANSQQGPQFEGYPKSGQTQNGDASMRGGGADRFQAANDDTAPTPLTPDQVNFLRRWRDNDRAIANSNLSGATDGGPHLQNSIYEYTKNVLKEQGLDKAGWEAYQSQTHSPLDEIGADIILINNKTGAMVFLDATSRRLDPKTGERVSGGKTNVPEIREAGVVDALPRWFDKGTNALDEDQEDPSMRQKVQDFKSNFREQMRELTSNPAPFNMKDFPLPYYGRINEKPGETKSEAVSQIQRVVDWAQRKAGDANRDGDRKTGGQLKEFGDIVRGALNFNKRTNSDALKDTMERTVNKVIAEEALRRAYPNLAPAVGNENRFQRLENGSNITADRSGTLVLNLKDNTPGKGGAVEVITAGSVTDTFAKSTGYWASAEFDQMKKAEFVKLLPGSVQKAIAAGTVNVDKILRQIGENRNVFAGGGAGVEKPLVGRVIGKLANHKAEGLRKMMTEAGAEVTGTEPSGTEVRPTQVERTTVKGSGASGRVNGNGTVETNYGRPKAGANGTDWVPGQAPAPKVGKVDLPSDGKHNGAVNGVAKDGHGTGGGAVDKNGKPIETSEHLTQEEIDVIKWAREGIEAKGEANMTPADREMANSYRFAESELSKPFGADPVRTSLVSRIREIMGSDVRGPLVSTAMLSVVVLNFYQAHKADTDDGSRAKFN